MIKIALAAMALTLTASAGSGAIGIASNESANPQDWTRTTVTQSGYAEGSANSPELDRFLASLSGADRAEFRRFYHVGGWCAAGGKVTSASTKDYGGQTFFPGWRYAGRLGGASGVVSNSGRSYTQFRFIFGVGGWDVDHRYDCARTRGAANATALGDRTCGILNGSGPFPVNWDETRTIYANSTGRVWW